MDEHSPPAIPGFRILAFVASGASGAVYRAEQEALGREVALKVLAPGLFDASETRSRFRREARILAGLNHPNLLRLFDAGFIGNRPYLVTEFVEGGSLRELIESEGALPLERVRHFGTAIAGALTATHRADVVHRDLKPDNVLLTQAGEVKLADFGLAKTQSTRGTVQTAAGVILGTPGYMAPEIIQGEPATAAADVYALGAILFEMLTGQKAFDGTDLGQVLRAHLEGPAPELSGLRAGLPEGVQGLVTQCLDAIVAKRPAAEEVERRLAQLVDVHLAAHGEGPRVSVSRSGRSALTAERTRRRTSATVAAARGVGLTQQAGPLRPGGRSRPAAIVAVLACVLAGSLLLVRTLSPSSDGAPVPSVAAVSSVPGPAVSLPSPRISVSSEAVHLWFGQELPGATFALHRTDSRQVTQRSVPPGHRDLLIEGLEPEADYRGSLEFKGLRRPVVFRTLPRLASSGCTRLSTAWCKDVALHSSGSHVAVAWSRLTGKWTSTVEFRESFDGGRTWGETESIEGPGAAASPSLICQEEGLHLAWTVCCPALVCSNYRSSPGSTWTTVVRLPLASPEPPLWLERAPDGRIAMLTAEFVSSQPVVRILYYPERPSGPGEVAEPAPGYPLEGSYRLYPMGNRLLALGGGTDGLRGCLLPPVSGKASWRVLVPPGPQGGSSRVRYMDLVTMPNGLLIVHEQVPSLCFYRSAPDLANCVKVGELDGSAAGSVGLVRPALVRSGNELFLVCNGLGLTGSAVLIHRADGSGGWELLRSSTLPATLVVSSLRATVAGGNLLYAVECASSDGVAVAALPLGPGRGSLLGGGSPATQRAR